MRRLAALLAPIFALLLLSTATGLRAAPLDGISSGDATASVREALAQGTEHAVAALGRNGGFLGNSQVRIPLPPSLQKAEAALRLFGLGKQADQLIETMNHAAESAVSEARPILADAIRKMSVQDARAILAGGEDSLTQYFRRTTSEQLSAKFLPIVKTATGKLQLAEQYNTFAGKAASAGMLDARDADLDSYVTRKAMDALFLMIAAEEKKLRSNPVEAGSALLKKVFGAL